MSIVVSAWFAVWLIPILYILFVVVLSKIDNWMEREKEQSCSLL